VVCVGSVSPMSFSLFKDVADFLTPVLTSSQFSSSGALTPAEFVLSGDQLVHACRTWKWEGGNKGTQKSYLPPTKQYLITRNVPCMCRANAYFDRQVPPSPHLRHSRALRRESLHVWGVRVKGSQTQALTSLCCPCSSPLSVGCP
jgi:hypothetical protein